MREAMPVSVMKPIMLATDSGCPASHSAATEPISASGTLPMMIERQHGRAVAAVEDGEDQRERKQREDARWCGWPPPAPGTCLRGCGEDALRQLDRLQLAADAPRRSRAMSAEPSRVGEHDDAPAAVLAQDLVGAVGLPDLGDLARRHPARRRLDQQVAEPVGGAQPVGQPHHHVEAAVAVDHARDHAAVRQPR